MLIIVLGTLCINDPWYLIVHEKKEKSRKGNGSFRWYTLAFLSWPWYIGKLCLLCCNSKLILMQFVHFPSHIAAWLSDCNWYGLPICSDLLSTLLQSHIHSELITSPLTGFRKGSLRDHRQVMCLHQSGLNLKLLLEIILCAYNMESSSR